MLSEKRSFVSKGVFVSNGTHGIFPARGSFSSHRAFFSKGNFFSHWDMYAILLLLFCLSLAVDGMGHMHGPLGDSLHQPVPTDLIYLPKYVLLTTLRMLIGIVVSLVFSILYATMAAKSVQMGKILIPLLDILQSVPVLGYLSFTVTGFLALFPGNVLGVECAVIFAIFTAQAWNMTFSFHQSLQAIPKDLYEVASILRLSKLQQFFVIELPYAVPGLIWNAMVSMSGAWFFIVASEAVTVGNTAFFLPGVGSFIATAIAKQDMSLILWAIFSMLGAILLYDQLFFRPLTDWAEKFRYETSASAPHRHSWCYELFVRTTFVQRLFSPIQWLSNQIFRSYYFRKQITLRQHHASLCDFLINGCFYGAVIGSALYAIFHFYGVMSTHITTYLPTILHCFYLGALTLSRIMVMMLITMIIWLPVGVYIGLRPRISQHVQGLAQMMAAFPSNLLYPPFVLVIAHFSLNPNIWLSPLIIFGTQWYILFNVVAGAAAFPSELKEAAAMLHLRKLVWWRKIMFPGVFPYFLTGAITSWGGAWNATILAEAVSWGSKHYEAVGLGAYITKATADGHLVNVAIAIAVMVCYVVTFNRLVWRPLYAYAENKLKLD